MEVCPFTLLCPTEKKVLTLNHSFNNLFFFFFNRYDKIEDLTVTSPAVNVYSHLLMQANTTKMELLKDSHQPLAFIEGYHTILLNLSEFPPIAVKLGRKTVLLERKAQTRVTVDRAVKVH